jgi:hypothetical protein
MLLFKWKDTPATFISPATRVGRSELKKSVNGNSLGILREPAFYVTKMTVDATLFNWHIQDLLTQALSQTLGPHV